MTQILNSFDCFNFILSAFESRASYFMTDDGTQFRINRFDNDKMLSNS